MANKRHVVDETMIMEVRRSTLTSSPTVRRRGAREGCESLRMLVFGYVGNEEWKQSEKAKVFEQKIGTKKEIRALYSFFSDLDENNTGGITIKNFHNFFTRSKEQRLLGWKAMLYLIGETTEKTATVQDFLKLLYLRADEKSIKEMMRWYDEESMSTKAVPEPPVISVKTHQELVMNFKFIDYKRTGILTPADLVNAGLLDQDMCDELMAKFDANGDGTIEEHEFVEMLCPNGYRASQDSTTAIDAEGNPLVKIEGEKFTGWIKAEHKIS
jgi:Ca2+-binding EF-hand superfamily protein